MKSFSLTLLLISLLTPAHGRDLVPPDYQGRWAKNHLDCRPSDDRYPDDFVELDGSRIEFVGASCRVRRFLFSSTGEGDKPADAFKQSFADADCVFEEPPGQNTRIHIRWLHPREVFEFGYAFDDNASGRPDYWMGPVKKCD